MNRQLIVRLWRRHLRLGLLILSLLAHTLLIMHRQQASSTHPADPIDHNPDQVAEAFSMWLDNGPAAADAQQLSSLADMTNKLADSAGLSTHQACAGQHNQALASLALQLDESWMQLHHDSWLETQATPQLRAHAYAQAVEQTLANSVEQTLVNSVEQTLVNPVEQTLVNNTKPYDDPRFHEPLTALLDACQGEFLHRTLWQAITPEHCPHVNATSVLRSLDNAEPEPLYAALNAARLCWTSADFTHTLIQRLQDSLPARGYFFTKDVAQVDRQLLEQLRHHPAALRSLAIIAFLRLPPYAGMARQNDQYSSLEQRLRGDIQLASWIAVADFDGDTRGAAEPQHLCRQLRGEPRQQFARRLHLQEHDCSPMDQLEETR